MWRPIETKDDLPPIGSRETVRLDFKAKSTSNRFEAAKDIAAFANAEGGTLLIGAVGGSQLVRYEPLSEADARAAMHVHEEAVRDRCSPAPLFSPVEIRTDGGSIVAINVWPFPGQLVGVRIKKDELSCGSDSGQPEGVSMLPLRVGTHTRSITPEQIPMFVDAHARRIAITLNQAVGQRVILIATRYRAEKGIWTEVAVLQSVDYLNNTVVLTVGHPDSWKVAIPIDLIEAACFSDNTWHVYVKGVFKQMQWAGHAAPEQKTRGLIFDPCG